MKTIFMGLLMGVAAFSPVVWGATDVGGKTGSGQISFTGTVKGGSCTIDTPDKTVSLPVYNTSAIHSWETLSEQPVVFKLTCPSEVTQLNVTTGFTPEDAPNVDSGDVVKWGAAKNTGTASGLRMRLLNTQDYKTVSGGSSNFLPKTLTFIVPVKSGNADFKFNYQLSSWSGVTAKAGSFNYNYSFTFDYK